MLELVWCHSGRFQPGAGFLSFLLSRAAVSLLCAKAQIQSRARGIRVHACASSRMRAGCQATLQPQSESKISKEHEELATVVEDSARERVSSGVLHVGSPAL